MTGKRTLFIVVNIDRFFLSHRKELAVAASQNGYEVTVVTKDSGLAGKITELGLRFIDLPVNGSGMNPREEWQTCDFLTRLYRKEKPDIVHHVGLKLIMWGTLAANRAGIPHVVNAVSGLGIMFSDEGNKLLSVSILRFLRYLHRKGNAKVIFQNRDDEKLFREHRIVTGENTFMIKGSGVDLERYHYTAEPEEGKIGIIITARMVIEKGILDLVRAAKILEPEYRDRIRFLLCGGLHDNPKAIKKEELEALCDGEYICWLGHRTDVLELLRSSHIVAFPSYYREGIPKSLIEAAAVGKPIVTCDSVGCRETVTDGVNGLLVPPKSPVELAKALKRMIEDGELRRGMGKASRSLAERDFSLDTVIREHLRIYGSFPVRS